MLVPSIIHAKFQTPPKCRIPLQSPPFSRFQPQNHPLDSTKTLFLTSGRFATYRPEPLVEDLLAVPLPTPRPGLLDNIVSYRDIDARAVSAFVFRDAEKVLIEDLVNYTVRDFQGDHRSPGRQPTTRNEKQANEPQLSIYCRYFVRVMKAGFGRDKAIRATIFQEEDGKSERLPYRLVAFELGAAGDSIAITCMKLQQLIGEFEKLDRIQLRSSPGAGVYQQRIARVYETLNGSPTVFIIKPDMQRYWTRSAALSDADEVALDLFNWQQATATPEVA